MNWRERIVIDPSVLTGKPIIKGTRLAVEFIIDLLAHDWTESEILRSYPGLAHEDIQACLMYVSDLLRTERVYPAEISQEVD
ncbi:protein of unknown function DUF433 [Methanosarcina horonobensis HB-1 = JCM 15518]|uniref:DUF433 domain-containing protein n=1 Tax=Methanosarcina horonobensis HB-1 = JCM 15518 TaxID=1434110 RepID=A0A0E3WUI9_9EURY|nr:DUF433 domain-containing protein [Methanosarcina horonobensis]AKB78930.1 protein of unknown function DUF433 [Methanosarcina horonobensis HB-1 = JCM 15518]